MGSYVKETKCRLRVGRPVGLQVHRVWRAQAHRHSPSGSVRRAGGELHGRDFEYPRLRAVPRMRADRTVFGNHMTEKTGATSTGWVVYGVEK
jgi:hypothetical protein